MEIIRLDLDDDGFVEQLWGVWQRSVAASRVQPQRQTLDEFSQELRYSFPGEHSVLAVAVEGGRVLGGLRLGMPLRDNLDKCWAEIQVDPEQRRRGVGGGLVEWTEQAAKEAGRSLVLFDVFVPLGERDTHGARRFGQAHGYSLASVEIVRRLELPVPAGLLDRHDAAATSARDGRYDVSAHVNGVPPEHRQSLCDASNRLGVDAPTGDVDFEPESMKPEDYQHLLDHEAATGSTRLTAVAVERGTGVVAAYSDIVLPAGDAELAFQWGTLVLPEHRGHRLGMAVKVANLRQLARTDPHRRTILTANAEDNPWMVQINLDLGFEIIEEALALKKEV